MWLVARTRRPVGRADHRLLRDDAGAHGSGAHAGAHSHSDQRGVGDGGVRAEHLRVHLHRPADPPDHRGAGAARAGISRLLVAAAVLATVIAVRIVWHMSFNATIRWRDRRYGFHPPRPMLQPTVGSGLVISWAGMRGIVTLAAALALPAGFPARDLIVLTAFLVVLGTLLIQGLTLKALLRALNLHDGDPVAREEHVARQRMLEAAYAQLHRRGSHAVELVRKNSKIRLGQLHRAATARMRRSASSTTPRYRAALQAARRGAACHARQRRHR